MAGIINTIRKSADQAIASSAVLADVFSQTIAPSTKIILEGVVYFSLGATGGVRVAAIYDALFSEFVAQYEILASTSAAILCNTQINGTAYTNALASASNNALRFTITLNNTATVTKSVGLQMAQNTSDVLPLTLLAGSWMRTTIV